MIRTLEEARTKRIVRKGKVVKITLKSGRPRKMTTKQRTALRKARRRAHSSSANRNRRKSMRVRRSRSI